MSTLNPRENYIQQEKMEHNKHTQRRKVMWPEKIQEWNKPNIYQRKLHMASQEKLHICQRKLTRQARENMHFII